MIRGLPGVSRSWLAEACQHSLVAPDAAPDVVRRPAAAGQCPAGPGRLTRLAGGRSRRCARLCVDLHKQRGSVGSAGPVGFHGFLQRFPGGALVGLRSQLMRLGFQS